MYLFPVQCVDKRSLTEPRPKSKKSAKPIDMISNSTIRKILHGIQKGITKLDKMPHHDLVHGVGVIIGLQTRIRRLATLTNRPPEAPPLAFLEQAKEIGRYGCECLQRDESRFRTSPPYPSGVQAWDDKLAQQVRTAYKQFCMQLRTKSAIKAGDSTEGKVVQCNNDESSGQTQSLDAKVSDVEVMPETEGDVDNDAIEGNLPNLDDILLEQAMRRKDALLWEEPENYFDVDQLP